MGYLFKGHYENKDTERILSREITEIIKDIKGDIVILCIGTDRSTGDSMGPLVGEYLTESGCPAYLYGTLESPVHAKNLEDTLKEISERHTSPFIIAVDACLGESKNIGCIFLKDEPINPGAAMKKNLPPAGNISLTGIVNLGGLMEFQVLQNTRLYTVNKLAKTIASSLLTAIAAKYNNLSWANEVASAFE